MAPVNIKIINNASTLHNLQHVGNGAQIASRAGMEIEDEIGISFIDRDRYDGFNILLKHFMKVNMHFQKCLELMRIYL